MTTMPIPRRQPLPPSPRHCRDARVYGHTTTAIREIEYISPIECTPPPPRAHALVSPVGVAFATVPCRTAALLFSASSHERLRPVVKPSAPSAGLLCCLAPPLRLNAKLFVISLEAPYALLLPPRGIALSPDHLPKHHPPRQARLPHTCHETLELYPSSVHRGVNNFGVCPGRRVAVE